MMMVTAECLAELVAGELVVGDDAAHHPGLLEHHEVAVQGALREVGTLLADLGHRQRALTGGEQLDDRRPLLRQTLTEPGEARRRCSAPVFGRRGGHANECNCPDCRIRMRFTVVSALVTAAAAAPS